MSPRPTRLPLLRDSVGRSDGSAGEREALLREGARLWFAGEGTGVGPARTKATLLAFQAPYVKEAHNDYLATLLERGPIGVIGLLLLVLAAATYLRRILGARLRGAWHDAVPRAWALVIAAPVLAIRCRVLRGAALPARVDLAGTRGRLGPGPSGVAARQARSGPDAGQAACPRPCPCGDRCSAMSRRV